MHSGRFPTTAGGSSLVAELLAVSVCGDKRLAEAGLAKELPWLTRLPSEARSECVAELRHNLSAGADTGAAFARALNEWKSTAEVYSDPELVRRLSGPFTTEAAVDVPRPGSTL